MTNIEQKALVLLNEVQGSTFTSLTRDSSAIEALCRAIEQHEAFRQEVSDAVVEYTRGAHPQNLGQFIIPKPKPDPLMAMAEGMGYYGNDAEDLAEEIRAALDALGFEIREKG